MGKLIEAVSNEEVWTLYFDDKWSITQIASHFSVSLRVIQYRLSKSGRPLRPRNTFGVDREILKELHVEKEISALEIARQLRVSYDGVLASLRKFDLIRPKAGRFKDRAFDHLKIGDSVTVPRPTSKGTWYSNFYKKARKRGIRVSVRTIDEKSVSVIRIDPKEIKQIISKRKLLTLYRDKGLSIRKVAKRLDCSDYLVEKELERHGIAKRGPGNNRSVLPSPS
jgi:hypothetical protein